MSILNNYNIPELSDAEIAADLARTTLDIETKTILIQELSRRQSTEMVEGMRELNQSIKDLQSSLEKSSYQSERGSKQMLWYTKVMTALTIALVLESVFKVSSDMLGNYFRWAPIMFGVAYIGFVYLIFKYLDKEYERDNI
jgi:hypothetical protein